MNLKTFVAALATCAVAMSACKTGEAGRGGETVPAGDMERHDEAAQDGDPIKRALALQRRALEILEANRDDAAAAAAALDALYEEREAEIEALRSQLAAMKASLRDDAAAAKELITRYDEEVKELSERTATLINEEPELTSSPPVVAAMDRLYPWPEDDDDSQAGDHGGGDDDGHAPAPDEERPKLTAEDKALFEEMVVVQERIVEILAANTNDPDKAGDELMKLADAQGDRSARFARLHERLESDLEGAAELMEKYKSRIVAIGENLSEVVRANPALVTHEEVQAAMARLKGAP